MRVTYEPAADQVVLLLRDNGCGMTQDTLRKIFDPYFSTKKGPDESGKGGTGLGLAACRDIIQKHGGRIRVESSVGKGTAFSIKFPAIQPPTLAPTFTPFINTSSDTSTPAQS